MKNPKKIAKEVKATEGQRKGIKIPEAIIERLAPFGKRFIKVAPPIPNDPKSGKKAVEDKFQEHPYGATDPELQEWLIAGGNYGILFGKGLIGIDTDDQKISAKLNKNTLTIQSGSNRGNHYIFMSDATENGVISDPKKPKNNLGNIQVHNKYLVGAGSIHYTGGTYKIVNDAAIAWISKKELEETFGNYLVWTGQRRVELEEEAKFEEDQIGVPIPLKDLIDLSELRQITSGEYQGAHPIHGSMTGQNFCANLDKNVWHCFRCNSGGGGLMWLAIENGLLQCHEAQKGALRGEKFVQAIKLAQERGFDIKLYDEDLSPDVARFFEKEKGKRKLQFIPALVASELMQEFQYATRKKDEMIFRYIPEKGIYEMFGEAHIKKQVRKKLGKHLNINRQREIINFIKVSTLKDLEESPEHLIALKNGILNVKTGKLEPFNPEHFILNSLNVEYKPQQDNPKFKKFLSEVINENDIATMQEFVGFCLLRDYRYQKALLLVGEGANGKSTFLETLRRLLGDENVSNEPLQTLITNRFALGQLYGKLANVYADLPSLALKETGTFKMLFGDTIAGEFKFQNRFNFRNYAKLIYSCNRIPETPDDTDAFFRRWIIINFPNQFLENNPNTDVNILAKITTPEELSGIINWALEGLQRLLEKNRFSHAKTIEETRLQYTRSSDSVKAFVEEHLEPEPNNIIPKDEVYEVYIQYCRENNLPAVGKTAFSGRLPQHIAVSATYTKRLGKQVRAWSGVKLQGMTHTTHTSHTSSLLYIRKYDDEKTENTNITNTGHTSKREKREPSDTAEPVEPSGNGAEWLCGAEKEQKE